MQTKVHILAARQFTIVSPKKLLRFKAGWVRQRVNKSLVISKDENVFLVMQALHSIASRLTFWLTECSEQFALKSVLDEFVMMKNRARSARNRENNDRPHAANARGFASLSTLASSPSQHTHIHSHSEKKKANRMAPRGSHMHS